LGGPWSWPADHPNAALRENEQAVFERKRRAGVDGVRQLNQRGCFADSECRARELLVEAERCFGPESLETASVLDALVASLQQAFASINAPGCVKRTGLAIRVGRGEPAP